MGTASASPIQRRDRSSVSVFDHVRIFVVTLVLSAALTFIVGAALLVRH